MRGLWRLLRSRRVALWLLAGLSVYVGAVTAVPQQAMSPREHAVWSGSDSVLVTFARLIGADRAYTNPVFLVLTGLLVLTTAACSWERTGRSWSTWRQRGTVATAVRTRLAASPDVTVLSDADSESLMFGAVDRLRSAGLRVRRGPRLTYAEAGAWGLIGSPLFHWSMVAFVLVVALGQLARWEGLLGVSEAGSVAEIPATYRRLSEGPLALPHTGWRIGLESVDEDFRIGKVFYGVTPTITLHDGSRLLARQAVYPNNPLRCGPLLVHLSDYGLAVRFEAVNPDGLSRGISDRLIDFDEESPSGATTSGFVVTDDDGEEIADIEVSVQARDRRGELPRLRPPGEVIRVRVTGASGESSFTTVPAGATIPLADGWSLKVGSLDYYARLSVVRDWSVEWIYALLGLISVGASIALLVPYRSVWLAAEAMPGGGARLDVVVHHQRRDPLFLAMVRGAIEPLGEQLVRQQVLEFESSSEDTEESG